MISEDIKCYYLNKMREAEKNAAAAQDKPSREHWRRIMDGYRSLAGLPPLAQRHPR